MAKNLANAPDESSVPGEPSDKKKEKETGFFAETKEFVKAILWALMIALFLRSFVVEAYKIPSGSMLPTLAVGDHIFVNKFLYGLMVPGTTTKFFMFRQPKRGEVIVFKFPPDVSKDYIKRIVGVPGDVIDVRDDIVYVNGEALPLEYQKDIEVVDADCYPQRAKLYEEEIGSRSHAVIQRPSASLENLGPFKVEPGHLFVMGDNRDNSADSAHQGYQVPLENVKGRAMFVWLSWDPCGSYWPFHKVRVDRFGEGVR